MADIYDPFDQPATSPEQATDLVVSLSPASPAPPEQPSSHVSPAVAAAVVSAAEMAAMLAELNKPEHRGNSFIPMPPHLVDSMNRLHLWQLPVSSSFLH